MRRIITITMNMILLIINSIKKEEKKEDNIEVTIAEQITEVKVTAKYESDDKIVKSTITASKKNNSGFCEHYTGR